MPPVTLKSRELRELQRRFKPEFSVEETSRNHYRIVDADGKAVRVEGKILTLPKTPHGGRQTKNIEATLKRAGILQEEVQPERRTNGDVSAAEKRRRERFAAAQAERQRNRQKVANDLSARLKTVLEPIGVWGLPGTPADLSYIGAFLARQQGKEGYTPDLVYSSANRVLNKAWVEVRYQELWNELAERLEEAPNPVEAYYLHLRRGRGLPDTVTVVESAAGTLTEGEWPFRVERLAIEVLFADHDYQRPVAWPFVRKTASIFDERLVGTIDVSDRGGSYAILDGQLRFEAMKLVGKTSVWCSIYEGFDKQSEARFFLHKNRDRKAIHPYYTFKARVAAGDEAAIAIQKIVKRHGYKLAVGASRPGTPTENNIVAITALEEAHARHSETRAECLDPALAVLAKTTRGLEQGQNASLIRGLARFFGAYDDEELVPEILEQVLTERSPGFMLGRARERGRENRSTTEHYMAKTIVDEYNRVAKRGEKIPAGRL